jgi:hypothetical protein
LGSLQDILQQHKLGDKGKSVNILDIAGSSTNTGPSKFFTTTAATNLFACEPDVDLQKKGYALYDTNWSLVATAGALHPAHVDAEGYLTYITVQTGVKLFIIALPHLEQPENYAARHDFFSSGYSLSLDTPEGLDLFAVVLRARDML